MRKKKPKTRKELFTHILDLWLENEIQCINEWCIADREKARKQAQSEFEEYLKLWEQLKEKR